MTEISPEILHTHTPKKEKKKREHSWLLHINYLSRQLQSDERLWLQLEENQWHKTRFRTNGEGKRREAFLHVATLLKQSDRFSVDLVGLQLWWRLQHGMYVSGTNRPSYGNSILKQSHPSLGGKKRTQNIYTT